MLFIVQVILKNLPLSNTAHLSSKPKTLVFSSFTVYVKAKTKPRVTPFLQFLDEDMIKIYLIFGITSQTCQYTSRCA